MPLTAKTTQPTWITRAVAAVALLLIVGALSSMWQVNRNNQTKVSLTRLRTLGMALVRYAHEHQGLLPDMSSPDAFQAALRPHYVPSREVFYSPWRSLWSARVYQPNPVFSRRPLGSIAMPEQAVVVFDGPNQGRSGGRYVVFLNGRFGFISHAQWQQMKAKGTVP